MITQKHPRLIKWTFLMLGASRRGKIDVRVPQQKVAAKASSACQVLSVNPFCQSGGSNRVLMKTWVCMPDKFSETRQDVLPSCPHALNSGSATS